MASVSVKLDISKLEAYKRAVRSGGSSMRRVWKQAAKRYFDFSGRRYTTLSRGNAINGESWEPISEVTKRRRRKARRGHKGGRNFAILIDTSTLRNSLLMGYPGSLIQYTARGIKVGIGGGARHDAAGMTIGTLATTHHNGNEAHGLPARPVITINLDTRTKRGIINDMKRELRKMGGF